MMGRAFPRASFRRVARRKVRLAGTLAHQSCSFRSQNPDGQRLLSQIESNHETGLAAPRAGHEFLMKFTPIILVGLAALLSGCIPLRQEARVKGPNHPWLMLYDERYLLTDINLNRETINTNQSYAESPAGKRYTFLVQPHQYDITQKRDYLSAELHPVAADGSLLGGWRSGIWSFHFVLETNRTTQIIDHQWKYWFFYYNPIIHGAPN